MQNHSMQEERNGTEVERGNIKEKKNQDGAQAPWKKMAAPQSKKRPPRKSGWIDVLGNGELKMKIIRQGKRNTRPQPSDVCDIKLVARLENGKVIEKYDRLRIQIGDHEVVQGLELALPLMNVGDKALLIIRPRFAYGSIGNPPDVPPNATMKYLLELLMADMETTLENIPHDERMTLATAKRQRGNWWYARRDTTKAVQCYRKAVDLLDETIPYVTPNGDVIENTNENIIIVIQEKMKVFNNLAAAQLIMEAYDSAMASILEVLKHEPNNVKALFRKSKILCAKGYVKEAIAPLRQAALLEPKNMAVISELNKCIELAEIEKQDEKNLYRKMFGELAKIGQQALAEEKAPEIAQPKPAKRKWTRFWKTIIATTFMTLTFASVTHKFKILQFF